MDFEFRLSPRCCVSVGMTLLDGGECLLPLLSRELFRLLPGETCGTSTSTGRRFPAFVLSNETGLSRQALCLVDPGISGTCLEALPHGRNGGTVCIGGRCRAAWTVSNGLLCDIGSVSENSFRWALYRDTRISCFDTL